MSDLVTVIVSHRVGKVEAIRRLKEGFGHMKDSLGAMIAIEQQTWEGNTLRFHMRAMGQTAAGTIQVLVQVGAGYPTAQITSPGNGTMVGPGTPITLTGQASDPEQGALSGASLRWYSDIDGFLGTGTTLDVVLSGPPQPCNPETVIHTITLEATDGDGHVGTHQRNVSVGFIC